MSITEYRVVCADRQCTPNTNPAGDDVDVAPGTDVAVDCWGRNIRLAIDPGGCTTYMQPTEARHRMRETRPCNKRRRRHDRMTMMHCMIMRRDA